MNDLHKEAAKNLPGVHPLIFDYQWKDDKTLIMAYKSKRGLIDIVVGLAKGVGKYFNENLQVTKIGSDKIQVRFYRI